MEVMTESAVTELVMPTVIDTENAVTEPEGSILVMEDGEALSTTTGVVENLEAVEEIPEAVEKVEAETGIEEISEVNTKTEENQVEAEESTELKDTGTDESVVTVTEKSNDTVATSDTVLKEEPEDDIICLDDDEDSGASDSKRPRKDEDDVMEVDENGMVSKEDDNIGKTIRKMSRSDLEDLVLAKIVEAIVSHTEVGQLRAKVLELQLQKDKMANKMSVMMKQVVELSSAVNTILENEARDPKARIGKPHVIRFNRSVGLQTSIEPGVRSAPPKIIRVPDASQNGVKQYGGPNQGKQPVYAGANGTFTVPSQPQAGVKRVYQAGNKAGEGNKQLGSSQTLTVQPSPRKVYSAASGPPRIHPIAPKPAQTQQQSSVTVSPVSQNTQPVVDLTDDDPPAGSTATQSSPGNNAAGTTIINGVQYQIVNRGASTTGVQLVSQGGAQQKYIVTPTSGQNRPVVLQNLGSTTPTNQQFVLRGVNNSGPITIVQRPMGAPRPIGTNGNLTRVAATIPVRPAGGVVLGTASNIPRRFVLPPLPTTPLAKVKNDMFKPPPKPELTLNEQADGIVLSWNLQTVTNMAEVTTYQIFACQESLNTATQRPSQWKRVGDVKALPLPMACTLSQFTEENRYYFIVRGIDVYGRVGPFCDPQNILLRKKKLN